ncbi:hypothetical protein ACFCX0_46480 [Streptomyces sp. NPDC056352]
MGGTGPAPKPTGRKARRNADAIPQTYSGGSAPRHLGDVQQVIDALLHTI